MPAEQPVFVIGTDENVFELLAKPPQNQPSQEQPPQPEEQAHQAYLRTIARTLPENKTVTLWYANGNQPHYDEMLALFPSGEFNTQLYRVFAKNNDGTTNYAQVIGHSFLIQRWS